MSRSDILKSALRSSIYSHKVSVEEPIDKIELIEEDIDIQENNSITENEFNFDFDEVINKVNTSSKLLNFNTTHKPMILEILDLIKNNQEEFIINKYQYTSFYWNGIPIFRIELKPINIDKVKTKELHISLHRYDREKQSILSEKKTQKILMFGLGGSLLLGIVAMLTMWRSPKD
jgi:hypothetical protein